MTSARIVACDLRKCQHFRGIVGPVEDPLFVCMAFPLGIPEAILAGHNLHNKPVAGDEGIVYEPPPGGEPKNWREKLP